MPQFGELLTLGLCVITALYLLIHLRTVTAVPALRSLILPFLLVFVAFVATVLEGLPAGGNLAEIIFWEEGPAAVERGGWPSALLNLVEHLGYAGAAVSLAVILWRRQRTPAEAEP